eukprot:1034736-Prymnesium_polylepis.2
MAEASLRDQSKDACNLWAAATTSWQALAHAYEVADGDGERRRPGAAFRPPTRADLSFGKKSGRYACAMLRPCKRRNGEMRRRKSLSSSPRATGW